MGTEEPERVEWFKATSGGFLGFLGFVGCAGGLWVIVYDGLAGRDVVWVVLVLLVALLTWTALLRPRVGLTRDDLVLRSMVSETRVPLAALEKFVVRSFTAAQADGRRYTSVGVGRTMKMMRPQGESLVRPFRSLRQLTAEYAGPDPNAAYPDHVEELVLDRMSRAREGAGVRLRSPEQAQLAAGVRRIWAWPEITAYAVLLVALVVAWLAT